MLDQWLRAIAHEDRQRLLVLLAQDECANISVPDAVVPDEQVGDLIAVRIELQHVHLPKLDNTGLINWDQERDVVTRGPNFENIRPLITAVQTIETPGSADSGVGCSG